MFSWLLTPPKVVIVSPRFLSHLRSFLGRKFPKAFSLYIHASTDFAIFFRAESCIYKNVIPRILPSFTILLYASIRLLSSCTCICLPDEEEEKKKKVKLRGMVGGWRVDCGNIVRRMIRFSPSFCLSWKKFFFFLSPCPCLSLFWKPRTTITLSRFSFFLCWLVHFSQPFFFHGNQNEAK